MNAWNLRGCCCTLGCRSRSWTTYYHIHRPACLISSESKCFSPVHGSIRIFICSLIRAPNEPSDSSESHITGDNGGQVPSAGHSQRNTTSASFPSSCRLESSTQPPTAIQRSSPSPSSSSQPSEQTDDTHQPDDIVSTAIAFGINETRETVETVIHGSFSVAAPNDYGPSEPSAGRSQGSKTLTPAYFASSHRLQSSTIAQLQRAVPSFSSASFQPSYSESVFTPQLPIKRKRLPTCLKCGQNSSVCKGALRRGACQNSCQHCRRTNCAGHCR